MREYTNLLNLKIFLVNLGLQFLKLILSEEKRDCELCKAV